MLAGNSSLIGGSLLGGAALQQQNQQTMQNQSNRDPKVSDLSQTARQKLDHLQYVRISRSSFQVITLVLQS